MADLSSTDAGPSQDAMGRSAGTAQPGDLRCCCGKEDCAFLKHNCSILLSVERDVHMAAKMGQVSIPAVSYIAPPKPLNNLYALFI
ncbi:hypothetical protein N656DRAFT_360554 [Canariomyces notabilis]|uniref:Uncharacterized protein n=1 Tax=Canariomyces notabilis TaxID=2074819 RepID=A0AAN6QFA4_9PEZI|nr:hypothetical protein N656DRAFT_360554 [Canariomyces arenarius]